MSDSPRNTVLPARAYCYYKENGLRSVADRSLQYFLRRYAEHTTVSTAELEQLAKSREAIWYAERENPITISQPDNPRLRTAFSAYRNTYYPGRAFVCELSSCDLLGDIAAGMYRGERLLCDTTRHQIVSSNFNLTDTVTCHRLKTELGLRPECSEETLFPLLCPDPSYYHWISEYLPKLRLLELYHTERRRNPTLLIEPQPRDFVIQSLELAGYGQDQWIEWDGLTMQVERLALTSHRLHKFDHDHPPDSPYQPSSVDFNWLRERMRSRVPDASIEPDRTRRIYISRQRTTRGRRVLNSEAVEDVFRARGFEVHVLEEYSFARQVSLFCEADIIAGPHGAGLTNMIFSDNPLIIELLPETVLRPHFYFLAHMMDFAYEGIVTSAKDGNVRVDIDELRTRLDQRGV